MQDAGEATAWHSLEPAARPHPTVRHCTALLFTLLHCTVEHYTSVYFTALYCSAFYFNVFHYALHSADFVRSFVAHSLWLGEAVKWLYYWTTALYCFILMKRILLLFPNFDYFTVDLKHLILLAWLTLRRQLPCYSFDQESCTHAGTGPYSGLLLTPAEGFGLWANVSAYRGDGLSIIDQKTD